MSGAFDFDDSLMERLKIEEGFKSSAGSRCLFRAYHDSQLLICGVVVCGTVFDVACCYWLLQYS